MTKDGDHGMFCDICKKFIKGGKKKQHFDKYLKKGEI